MNESTVRIDARAAIPVAVLAVVVLAIMFVELCGKEDISDLVQEPSIADAPTPTLGPTFTPGPSPTPAPVVPTPSPTPLTGGSDRDVTRVQDLTAVQASLAEIFADQDRYPDTEGTIQTLCVFSEFDKGCALEDVMAAIPSDPLGEPSVNGYWYVSDGSSYTLYARREAERLPDCTDHPDFLSHVPSLICFSAP